MRIYEFRVSVLTEDGTQCRFGATTYGLGDKLARTLVFEWPYALKTFLSMEQTGRVLKTYDRAQILADKMKRARALYIDPRRQAE